jgi:2'-hydroxyisoflavone reductase
MYLFVSSISAHTDDMPPGTTEDVSVHQPPFPDTEEVTGETYGPLKVACEDVVRETFGERALIIRPGYIVGPHDPTDRFTYWVRRVARGGRMLAAGPADYAMQWVDARDLAAFELSLLERSQGGTFGVVTPPGRHTMGELLDTSRTVAGADTTYAWIDTAFAAEHDLLESDDQNLLPLWTPTYPGFHLFDSTRAHGAGLVCRSLEETIRDTLAWDDERGAPWPMQVGLTDEREAELLAALDGSG